MLVPLANCTKRQPENSAPKSRQVARRFQPPYDGLQAAIRLKVNENRTPSYDFNCLTI